MFLNYCKDGDCWVCIRTVGITIYWLIAQSTYCTVNSNVLTSYTVNSNVLIAQSIPIYLFIAQSIPMYLLVIAQSNPIVSISHLLGICRNYCEFSLHGILLSKVWQGCGILSLLTFTFSKTFKSRIDAWLLFYPISFYIALAHTC